MKAEHISTVFVTVLAVCLAFPVPSSAVVVTGIDLTLDPVTADANTLNLDLDVSGTTQTDSTGLVGNIVTDLEIDFFSLGDVDAVTGISFTGGHFEATNTSLLYAFDLGILGSLNAEIKDVGGYLRTPSPFGAVSGTTFPTNAHEFVLDEGQADAVSSGLVSFEEHFDFATDNMVAAGQDGVDGTVTVVLDSVNGGVATYNVSVAFPVMFDEILYEDLVTVTASGSGTIVASGQFTVPEPSSIFMLSGLALAAFVAWYRKR